MNLEKWTSSRLAKRIFANTSIGLLGSIFNTVFSLVKTAILTKSLEIEYYGLVMIVINFYAILNVILDVKVGDILFRYFKYFEGRNHLALRGIICLSLALCLFISILTILVVICLGERIAIAVYCNSFISTLISIYLIGAAANVFMSFSSAVLRIRNRFGFLVGAQVLGNAIALTGLGLYSFLWNGVDIKVMVFMIAIGMITSSICALALAFRFMGLSIASDTLLSIKSLHQYKGEIWSLILQTNLAAYLKLGSDRGGVFLLSVMSTPKQVAIYSVALQLTSPFKLLQSNIQAAIYPEVVLLYGKSLYAKLCQTILNITLSLAVTGLLAIVIASFVVEPVVIFFTTDAYADSTIIVMITIATALITMASLCFYPLTVAMDQMRRRNWVVSIRFIYLFLMSIFGISATGLAYVQLAGTATTRFLHDWPLFIRLRSMY